MGFYYTKLNGGYTPPFFDHKNETVAVLFYSLRKFSHSAESVSFKKRLI